MKSYADFGMTFTHYSKNATKKVSFQMHDGMFYLEVVSFAVLFPQPLPVFAVSITMSQFLISLPIAARTCKMPTHLPKAAVIPGKGFPT